MTEMRLQKFLARAGVASRRHAEELIAAGRVTVNGARVTEMGVKVNPAADAVAVDGAPVALPKENATFLLHKPAGYVTTMSDPQGRPTVAELMADELLAHPGLFPVGRLDTDTTGEGAVVLSPGQTPQTSPDTADFTISSMGFDGQGRFHIRLAMAEGFDAGWLLAVPYDAAGKQMGSTLEQTAVDGGMDYTIGGVAPDDVADMASIRVYGAYRGPEAAIEGEWSLPVELEPAEQRVILVGRTLEDGFYVERIEVSGMNIAVYYRGGDKSWFVVWATDKNGVRTGVPMGMMSAGAEDGLNLGLWSFETPAALDELASVTLLGETFPLE